MLTIERESREVNKYTYIVCGSVRGRDGLMHCVKGYRLINLGTDIEQVRANDASDLSMKVALLESSNSEIIPRANAIRRANETRSARGMRPLYK